MNWLLLRGLGRVQEHWFHFPQLLRAGPHTQIECLDLPGFGHFAHVETPFTIRRHTDFLREEFHLRHKRSSAHPSQGKWSIIGLSLGGMVALDWAHRFPNDFEKLVVINTSARDVATLFQRFSPFGFYRVARALSAPTLQLRERQILKMVSNTRAKDKKLLEQLVTIAKDHPIDRFNLGRQLIAAAQFKCPEKIEIPTLMVASLKDRMVDSRCSKIMGERLRTQLKFHPTAGHDLPIDDAEWLAAQVREFVG